MLFGEPSCRHRKVIRLKNVLSYRIKFYKNLINFLPAEHKFQKFSNGITNVCKNYYNLCVSVCLCVGQFGQRMYVTSKKFYGFSIKTPDLFLPMKSRGDRSRGQAISCSQCVDNDYTKGGIMIIITQMASMARSANDELGGKQRKGVT